MNEQATRSLKKDEHVFFIKKKIHTKIIEI